MRSRSLAVALLSSVLVLAGCREYGPLEEEVVDISWVRVGQDLEFSGIAVTSSGVLYGATVGETGHLVRSDDRGETWHIVLTVQPNWTHLGGQIAVGPDDELYVTALRGVEGSSTLNTIGLYRSGDGSTWHPLSQTWTARSANALAVTSNGTVLLGTRGGDTPGLFRSINRGTSWETTSLQSASSSGGIRGGTLATGPNGVALAFLSGAGFDINGLYRSENNGQSWVQLPAVDFNIEAITIADGRVVYATGAFVAPRTGDAVLRSDNLGDRWSEHPQVLPSNSTRGIAPRPRRYVYLAGGFTGVHRSEDGGVWEQVNEGFPDYETGTLMLDVFQVVLAPDGYLYANTTGGLYRSTGRVE